MSIYKSSSNSFSKEDNSKIIYSVSAPCATGKTDSGCEFIKANYDHRNHLYLAPSIGKVNETHQTLRDKGVEATAITSQTHPFAVKANIVDYLDACEAFENVLCVTWQSYVELDYFIKRPQAKEQWTVIIDEIPGLDEFFPRIVPRNLPFLTEIVELGERVNDKIAKVVIKNRALLEELYRSADDERDTVPFRPWYGALLSPGKEMYVDIESWTRIVIEKAISKKRNESESNAVYFLSMLRPEPFENAILMGANVENSLVYHWMTKRHGCRFVEHREIKSRLRKVPEDLGSRLTIFYGLPGRNSSLDRWDVEAKMLSALGDTPKMRQKLKYNWKSWQKYMR